MKVVVKGQVATLYDNAGKAILRITTENDLLTTEVLDIKQINDVEVSQVAEVVTGNVVGVIVDSLDTGPGVTIQREKLEPPGSDGEIIGQTIDHMCKRARRGKLQ